MPVKDLSDLTLPGLAVKHAVEVSKVLALPSMPRHFTTYVADTSSSRGRVGQAEMLERYSGQIRGSLWALGFPLLTMGASTFSRL